MSSPIAERILHIRGKMSQIEFARRLGINPNTLRSYERGKAQPNQEILARICTEFGVDPSWILLGNDSPYIADCIPSYESENEHKLREKITYLTNSIEKEEKSCIELKNKESILIKKIESLRKHNLLLHKLIISTMIIETKQMKDRFEMQKTMIDFVQEVNFTKEGLQELFAYLNNYIAGEIDSATKKIESLSESESIISEQIDNTLDL